MSANNTINLYPREDITISTTTGINVLSLFDGMSCGRIALERAGIEVDNYYSSEIKNYAIKVNVRMKQEHENIINELLNCKPIVINYELVAPHLRHRLYWTNIPFNEMPKDKGLKLNDILINGYSDRDKARTLLESDSRPLSTPIKMAHRYFNTCFTTLIFESKEHYNLIKEHFDKYFKGKTAKEIDELSKNMDLSFYNGLRYMNNREREACQTIPCGYTDSLTQNEAACILGDGWTIDVIAHILKGIR